MDHWGTGQWRAGRHALLHSLSGHKHLKAYARSLALYSVVAMGALILTMPFAWLVASSLKDQADIWLYPPQWIPNPVRWQNYLDAMRTHPFHVYFQNTMVLVIVSELATVGSASISAYGFAKYRFPCRQLLFAIVLSTLMLPDIVLLIPRFIMFRYLRWLDTYLPLLVPQFFGGSAFFVFLFRQFFISLPMELSEAAKIDGSSEFGTYWRIIMPLSQPVITTAFIFVLLGTWNDFMGPLIYITTDAKRTLALGLAHFKGYYGTEWHLLMAACVMVTLPVIAVFFAAQRYFLRGMVFTGLKG